MQYPYERINLPSNGQLYNNSLSSGKINLLPLTAKHEDILCSPGLFKDFTHFDIVLKDIIQNEDVDINKLLQVDVEGIMLAAKMLAFGPKKKAEITCPHCDKHDEYIIDFSKYKPIEAIIPSDRIYRYENYGIHYGIPTYELFKKLNGNKSKLTQNLIVSVFDKSDNRIDKMEFIKNKFLYRDYQKFKNFLTHCFPRITPEIEISCSSCDNSIKLPFIFDKNFFGMDGLYKINLHKEIFSILYASNGGFSHTDIYNMPINLRLLYTKELMNIKQKESDQMKQSEDAPSSTPIASPPIPK